MTTSIRKESDMDADKVKFRGVGISFTATAGTTTSYDYKLTEARLISGTRLLIRNQAWADTIRFQVVDVDNVLGYGAGVVLDEFATNWCVTTEKEDQGPTILPYSAEVLANLYIRFIYNSTGAQNVDVKCNIWAHKYMA
jgi:hypothetical protein